MRKAICIDPSGAFRQLLARILQSKGWQVETYADLPAAAEITSLRNVRLITTAAQLPSGDYAQHLPRLRELATAITPIVLLTANNADDTIDLALEKGITEVFDKLDLDTFTAYLDTFPVAFSDADSGAFRALVVDDERSVAGYLGKILGSQGFGVDLAYTFDEALRLAVTERYDLIVTDVLLSGRQSGNHLIRALRQTIAHTTETPIIVISGYSDEARQTEALRAGANIYLPKPIDEDALIFHARRLLAGIPAPRLRTKSAAPQPGISERLQAAGLTVREEMICAQLVEGLTDKAIASALGISYWTVRTHLTRIFRKCGTTNRIGLINHLQKRSGSTRQTAGEAQDWQSLIAHIVDAAHHGVLVTDAEKNILYVNQTFTKITGYSAEEAIGNTPRLLRSGKHTADFYRSMHHSIAEAGQWTGEIWNRHKNGVIFLERLHIRGLSPNLPIGARYVAEFSDITEQNVQMTQIRHSALHDDLTGLANRALLQDRVAQEISRAKRSGKKIGLLFIDLDRFKAINDTLGHRAGDEVLRTVAARAEAALRRSDTLSRFGGDEFVAIIPEIANRTALKRAIGKIFKAITRTIEIDGNSYHLGASIGCSIFPDDGGDFETLLKEADRAMYRAKNAGGNVAEFCESSATAPASSVQL